MNKMLLPYDIVGGSFWLISVGMIGATLFFFFERSKVSSRFHTPMTMIAVVCLMSSIHYFFVKKLMGCKRNGPDIIKIHRLVFKLPNASSDFLCNVNDCS